MTDAKARIAAMLGNALVEREMLIDQVAALTARAASAEAESAARRAAAKKPRRKVKADGVSD